MVAIAADDAFELRLRFLVGAVVALLVDHQHAHLVARIEQGRRRRVVRAAPGVGAHLLELRDAPAVERVGDAGADARMVVMVGGAEQFDRRAVEEESALRVERDRADAEAGRRPLSVPGRRTPKFRIAHGIEVRSSSDHSSRRLEQSLWLDRRCPPGARSSATSGNVAAPIPSGPISDCSKRAERRRRARAVEHVRRDAGPARRRLGRRRARPCPIAAPHRVGCCTSRTLR